MDKELSILALMIRDHSKIESLINKFEKSIDLDEESMSNAFEKMQWTIEKHLFVEEKAIFVKYNPDDILEGYKMMPTLTTQHNEILNRLKNMRDDIIKGIIPENILGFKTLLNIHKNFEERDVYPKLDEALKIEDKKQIIEKLNEIKF